MVAQVGDTPFDNTGYPDYGDYSGGVYDYGWFNGIWFSFTAPTNGAYTINNCKSPDTDTLLAVFPDTTCFYSIPYIAAIEEYATSVVPTYVDVNDSGYSCDGDQSEVYITATAGSTYYILLAQYVAGEGAPGTLTISEGFPSTRRAGKAQEPKGSKKAQKAPKVGQPKA